MEGEALGINWGNIIAIIGGLGGFKFFEYLANLKSKKRNEVANAAKNEVEAKKEEFNLWKIQIDYLQTRLDARDAKVDVLYKEKREAENKVLTLIAENNALELKLQEAENWRCNIMDCLRRDPPKNFKRFNEDEDTKFVKVE